MRSAKTESWLINQRKRRGQLRTVLFLCKLGVVGGENWVSSGHRKFNHGTDPFGRRDQHSRSDHELPRGIQGFRRHGTEQLHWKQSF